MFTASLPPSIIASVRQALRMVKAKPELRTRLWRNIDTLYDGFANAGFILGPQKGPVVAVHLPDVETGLAVWKALLDSGVYVNLAVPPATPNSAVLLRCSICAAHSDEQLNHVIDILTGIGEQLGILPRNQMRAAAG
jgi:8-amino-7-oxononanoate synthase